MCHMSGHINKNIRHKHAREKSLGVMKHRNSEKMGDKRFRWFVVSIIS